MTTQDSDVFRDTDPGIAFTADDQSWTISAGVMVASGSSPGVASNFAGSTLINNGAILSASEGRDAVELEGGNSFLLNGAGARIIGAGAAITLNGAGVTVINHGAIVGLTRNGIELDFNSNHVSLTNDGSIYGRENGVANSSDFDSVVHNLGLITSSQVGFLVNTDVDAATVITNARGAVIQGDQIAIKAGAGQVSLINNGTIAGDVELAPQAENDRIANHGRITGTSVLDAGDDVFIGTGGTSGEVDGGDGQDRLTGSAIADRFCGDSGNDRLIGAGGNDQLNGGIGLDTLTGGAGRDRFIFNNLNNADRITDFTANIDKIALDLGGLGPNGVLAAAHFHVGAAAADQSDRIIYNAATGFLFYDGDGKGGAGEVHFATLAPHLALHHTDFLVQFFVVE